MQLLIFLLVLLRIVNLFLFNKYGGDGKAGVKKKKRKEKLV